MTGSIQPTPSILPGGCLHSETRTEACGTRTTSANSHTGIYGKYKRRECAGCFMEETLQSCVGVLAVGWNVMALEMHFL